MLFRKCTWSPWCQAGPWASGLCGPVPRLCVLGPWLRPSTSHELFWFLMGIRCQWSHVGVRVW